MPVQCTCRRCGKSFVRRPIDVRRHGGAYCSQACRWGTPEQRFWPRVQKTAGGCWIWQGSRLVGGYGRMTIDYRAVSAHRFSWELHHGPIPDSMMVCHLCDNPPCVNPAHLFLGAAIDNHRDMASKGRRSTVRAVGESAGRAKLTEAQVREIFRRGAVGTTTCNLLAREFNVTTTHIRCILARKTWRHLDMVDHATASNSEGSTMAPNARTQAG